ncbi:MAG: AmmeMemoRadiSam system radical SAM enzyme [Alphaproteobacteria bacterium]
MITHETTAAGSTLFEVPKEATLYEKVHGQAVICNLCAHRCYIPAGRAGICKIRENRAGRLYTLVYDRIIALGIDPIEKKPFFHFLPSARSYSIATVGCNFHCRFCQNWEISQMPREHQGLILGQTRSPQEIVREALDARCETIAYTYTEPTIFFELAYDTARIAAAAGLKNLFVSNGYMTAEALRTIQPYLHAANIDLKGFDDKRHRRLCGAKLQPVLDSIRLIKKLGIWLEVTTLVIPGHNDSDSELRQMALFLKDVGPEIPWHLSAFFPAYKMLRGAPTDDGSLLRAWRIGKEAGLRYVYCGNLPGLGREDTDCFRCGETLIERAGFYVRCNRLKHGRCPNCQTPIDGTWGNHSWSVAKQAHANQEAL